jgi:hypothetical protein
MARAATPLKHLAQDSATLVKADADIAHIAGQDIACLLRETLWVESQCVFNPSRLRECIAHFHRLVFLESRVPVFSSGLFVLYGGRIGGGPSGRLKNRG